MGRFEADCADRFSPGVETVLERDDTGFGKRDLDCFENFFRGEAVLEGYL